VGLFGLSDLGTETLKDSRRISACVLFSPFTHLWGNPMVSPCCYDTKPHVLSFKRLVFRNWRARPCAVEVLAVLPMRGRYKSKNGMSRPEIDLASLIMKGITNGRGRWMAARPFDKNWYHMNLAGNVQSLF